MQLCRNCAKLPLDGHFGFVPWLHSTAQPYHGRSAHNSRCSSLATTHVIQSGPRSHQYVSAAASAAVNSGSLQQPQVLRGLYPASTPYASGYLKVSSLHSIYYEIHGNPHGVPAVLVHGGPGAGCFPNHARFFDAHHYKIILLDQRGCGRSNPSGCLLDNTTSALVNDLEALRQHLRVGQWLMLGGSWGVALSIAYAQAFPQAVLGLILRGVCLMRPQEIQWMYGGGAAALKPLAWSQFVGQLPAKEQGNPVLGYYKRLLSTDPAVRTAAAKGWMAWEMAVGFSGQQNLLVWDGQDWAAVTPQQQQHPAPPPKPAGAAAAAAAAAVYEFGQGSEFLLQQRGVSLPSGVVTGPSYSSYVIISGMALGEKEAGPSGLPPPQAAATGMTSAPVGRRSSTPQQALQQPPGAGDANNTNSNKNIPSRGSSEEGSTMQEQHQSSWVWGLPGQGFNTQDPEVQQLVWQGLNYQGFGSQGFGVQALLECHYSLHGAFLLDQPLLEHTDSIRHIPCIAVQGQLDFVCPPSTAVDLHKAWPEMELRLVPGAGHSMYDPGITHELVTATARMKDLLPDAAGKPRYAGPAAVGRVPKVVAAAAGAGPVVSAVDGGGASVAGGGGGHGSGAMGSGFKMSNDRQVNNRRSRRAGGR